MTRRVCLLILLAAVGCGGPGGGLMSNQKFKSTPLKPEQVVEVDNDTEAWGLGIDATPADQPYLIKLSADQPFEYTFAPKMTTGQAYEAHTKPEAKTVQQVNTEKGKKEYTLRGTIGANIPATLLVVRGIGSGPTKITVKREQ